MIHFALESGIFAGAENAHAVKLRGDGIGKLLTGISVVGVSDSKTVLPTPFNVFQRKKLIPE